MRAGHLLVALLTVLPFTCHAFLSNFGGGGRKSSRNRYEHQQSLPEPEAAAAEDDNSFGRVNIPLGDDVTLGSGFGQDEHGSWAGQRPALDPLMYMQYHEEPQSAASSYPPQDVGFQMPPMEPWMEAYALPPPMQPPGSGNMPQGNEYYYPPSYASSGYAGTEEARMSYPSFGQPMGSHQGGYPGYHQGQTGHHPLPTPSGMTEQTQAMDALNLGGRLGRIRTGASGEDAVGSSSSSGRRGGKGKGKATVIEGQERRKVGRPRTREAREPQTARLATREDEEEEGGVMEQPSTARLATSAANKREVRMAVRAAVMQAIADRQLTQETHAQDMAAQICEMKLRNAGHESAIGHVVMDILAKAGFSGEFLFDFRGWSAVYRFKVNSLRTYYKSQGYTGQELLRKILGKYRDIPIASYHGTLSDPAQEQQAMQLADQVWYDFYETRLFHVLPSNTLLPPLRKIARNSTGYTYRKLTHLDALTMIKKYMRHRLGYSYVQIEELDGLLLLLKSQRERGAEQEEDDEDDE